MAKAQQVEPRAALDYWKRKQKIESWDYQDVWKSEHATAFTVAKTAQLDVLDDLHTAVEKAIKEGQSWHSFKKGIDKTLQEKGWWGKKPVRNPKTGKLEEVQLGSYRRLKTIYETNTRQSYNAGRYESGMRSSAHPYILYRLGPSRNHRADHTQWDGLCLPKDDPFWDTHHPMNGWGCKCWTQFVSKRRYQEYSQKGIPKPILNNKGQKIGEQRQKMRKQRPQIEYTNWRNKKTGQIEKVPKGLSPGFDWNPGGNLSTRALKQFDLLEQRVKFLGDPKETHWNRMLQNVVNSPAYYAQYEHVLKQWLKKEATENSNAIISVGYLSDAVYRFADKKGIDLGNSGLLIMRNRIITKEKGHALKGEALSSEEWLGLWPYYHNPIAIYWDTSTRNFVYIGKRKNDKLVLILVGKRGLPRKQKPVYELDEVASAYGEYESLNDIEHIQKKGNSGLRYVRIQ